MRRRLLLIFAVAMTAIALLIPSFASAAELPEGVILDEVQRSSRAEFEFKRGCIETHIHIFNQINHQDWMDGSVYDETISGIYIDQYNTCTEESVLGIEFYAEDFDVNVSEKLTGARLRGEGMANNYVNGGGEIPVKLNIFWVPAGRVNSETESMEFVTYLPTTGEEVAAISTSTDIGRQAIAMGALTVGNQFFPLFARDHNTLLYGFDATWTIKAD
jgi:hypothetical protein